MWRCRGCLLGSWLCLIDLRWWCCLDCLLWLLLWVILFLCGIGSDVICFLWWILLFCLLGVCWSLLRGLFFCLRRSMGVLVRFLFFRCLLEMLCFWLGLRFWYIFLRFRKWIWVSERYEWGGWVMLWGFILFYFIFCIVF